MAEHFNLKIVQRGEDYIVSGAGTLELYKKLQHLPPSSRTLDISNIQNGSFIIRKNTNWYEESKAGASH